MKTLFKLLLVASVLISLLSTKAPAQYSFVNVSSQLIRKTATAFAADPSGNVIVVGNFDTSITIGGTTLINSNPNFWDIAGNGAYIAKITPSGTYAWVKSIGINSFIPKKNCSPRIGIAWIKSASADASGNFYLTGSFVGSLSFDAITIVSSTNSGGGCPDYSWDMFTAKISPSGSFIWVKKEGIGNYSEDAYSVNADAAGNVYVTGTQVDALVGSNPVCSLYVLKYNSSGTKLWEKKYTSSVFVSNRSAQGTSIVTDGTNAYVAGGFTGTINFGGGYTFNTGTVNSSVVLKLDGSGNTVWAKAYTKVGVGNLLLDNSNADLYFNSSVQDTVVFGSITVIESDPSGNPVLVKCSSATGVPTWAVITGYRAAGAIFKHPGGSIGVPAYEAGQYFGIKEFDASGVQTNATVATSDTIFSTSLRIAGYPGGYAYVQNLRGIYTFGGITMGTQPYYPSSSFRDIGVLRYTAPPPPAPLSVIGKFGIQGVDVFPNPVQQWLYIKDKNDLGRVDVFDLNGRLLLSKHSGSKAIDLDLSQLPSGMYLVKAEHWAKPIKIQKL